MFVYRLDDLFSKLNELKDDGFEYVDIYTTSSSGEEDGVPAIAFEGIFMENSSVDFEEVEAVTLPEGYYLDY